jgi:hypothetical protein
MVFYRLVGEPDNYKVDSINLYEGERFNGDEQYYYQDAPVLSGGKLER